MGADFKLGDLLALELHLYADACAEIVDRAHKELTIEKQISKIEATWAVLSLTFAPLPGTALVAVAPSSSKLFCIADCPILAKQENKLDCHLFALLNNTFLIT